MSGVSPEEKTKILKKAQEYLAADIRLFSACQDEQQTSDCSNVRVKLGLRKSKQASLAKGEFGGVCTSAMLKLLYLYHSNPEDNGKRAGKS